VSAKVRLITHLHTALRLHLVMGDGEANQLVEAPPTGLVVRW